MRRLLKIWGIQLLSVGFAGCYYAVPERGQSVITRDLSEIVVDGKTTKKEVRAALGRPHKTSFEGAADGPLVVWRYYYSSKRNIPFVSIGGHNDATREWTLLTIQYNLTGVVAKHSVEHFDAALDDKDKESGIHPRIGGTVNLR